MLELTYGITTVVCTVSLLSLYLMKQKNHRISKRLSELKSILYNNDIAVWVRDIPNNTMVVTKGIEDLLEIPMGDFSADPDCWLTIVYPEDIPKIHQQQEWLKNGKPFTSEYRVSLPQSKSIKWLQARATPILDESGRVVKIRGALIDITARKQAEYTNGQLLSILESTTNFVALADASKKLIYCNRAAQAVLGITRDDYTMKDIHVSDIHPEGVNRLLNSEAFPVAENTGVWKGVTSFLTRQGREVPLVQVIHAHKSMDRKVEYYSTIAFDMSEEKTKEEARISKLTIQKTLELLEEERKKMAQELHDSIGQTLYSVILGLSILKKAYPYMEMSEYIQKLIIDLDVTMKAIRQFSFDLRPSILDQFGLEAALEDLASQYRHSEQDRLITIKYLLSKPLSQRFQINLYRIVQEALRNASKHADFTTFELELAVRHQYIVLMIRDDGSGFEPSLVKHGLGLSHIKERVNLLKGELQLFSEPGKGTRFIIHIPEAEGTND